MRLLLCSLIGLGCIGPALTEETYRIRLRAVPDVGKSIDVKAESYEDLNGLATDEKGKEVKKVQIKTGARQEYTEMVEKVEKGQPVKFHRVYHKARVRFEMKKKYEKAPYEGKKVLFVKKAKGWQVTDQGGKELPDGSGEVLGVQAELGHLNWILPLLPDKAVKVGETWAVDDKMVRAMLLATLPPAAREEKVDVKGTKGSGKLVKVYRKGKRVFGVLEISADVGLKPPITEAEAAKATVTFKSILKASVDAVIDGSDTECNYSLTLTSTLKFTGKENGKILNGGNTTKHYVGATVSTQK
jgi:hypothetical protein